MNAYRQQLNINFNSVAGEIIDPDISKRCLYWTYPLFNINFGDGLGGGFTLANLYDLDHQRSPYLYKNLLTKFINKQYSTIIDDARINQINMLGVLNRIEKLYLSDKAKAKQNLPKIYEDLHLKIIKNPNILTNLNIRIQEHYEKLIQILQQFNNANIGLTLSGTFNDEYIKKLSKQLNNYISIEPLRENVIDCLFEIFNTYLIHDSLSKYPSLAFSKFNLVKQDFVNNTENLFNFIYINILHNLYLFK